MKGESTLANVASQWLSAAFLTVTLGFFFLFASAFQVSSEGTAQRILRRGVATTTEIDAILPQIETELRTAAQNAEGDSVRVPNFPLPVDVPKEEAGRIRGEELRNLILQQSADRLYDDGMSAWAETDPEAEQDIRSASTAGGMHSGFGFLTERWNTIFLIAAALFAFLSLVLGAILWISLNSYLRLLAIGAAISAAAVISLAAAVGARFALRTAESGADPFEKELLDLGVNVTWLFIRNYLILSLLGFLVVGVSSLFLWWQSRSAVSLPARGLDTTA